MHLYIKEGYAGGKEQTERLIWQALHQYEQENGIEFAKENARICRQERGKPYFDCIPVEFSVSHTGDLWVCLMNEGNQPIGVDIQIERNTDYEKIAKRYFTQDEQQYISKHGRCGFFRLWARKEAYAKYTGDGITRKLSDVSTQNNIDVFFMDFQIKEDVAGACCTKEKSDLWIRKIL